MPKPMKNNFSNIGEPPRSKQSELHPACYHIRLIIHIRVPPCEGREEANVEHDQ